MDAISIKKCVLTLKPKHSEGFNKIPQRILLDEVEIQGSRGGRAV
jgi:hypothetical protein